MNRFLFALILGLGLTGFAASKAIAQTQNVVAPSTPASTSNNSTAPLSQSAIQPADESAPPSTAPSSADATEPATATNTRAAAEIENPVDPASLIPDLPTIPKQNASLVGGTIAKLDRLRDQMVVQTFGGGKMKISFDPRTHFFRGSVEGTPYDLKPGDRVYVDTELDGDAVFARNIRVKGVAAAGEGQGTVLSYRSDRGELLVRDALSPQALKVRVTPQTRVLKDGQQASAYQLEPGSLIALKFGAQQDGRDVAREISILAVPGSSFTFAGTVTAINLRLGIIVIHSSTDNKTYEVYVDPAVMPADNVLQETSDVTILARFDGRRYVARTVTVNSPHP